MSDMPAPDLQPLALVSPPADQGKRPPGRPRSVRADEAIIEAVLDLIAEGTTVEALSMEAVAARAGVGKATIYRRWSSKDDLITDAVVAVKGPIPELAGESVRADLIALLEVIRRNKLGRLGKIMPCLVPEIRRNPQLYARYQQAIEPRREILREVLRRGVRTGELRPDIDIEVVMLLLNGPMLVQNVLDWNPHLDPERLPEQLVDLVLAGVKGPAG